jgi:DNA (cytosine-5)-methyltransferase 1
VNVTFFDICSGIGGFRLGMEQAGHKCLGFIEKDKFAVKSYKAMYNTDKEYYHDNIFTARAEELPDADIWCFGFPCQPFSIAGKRGGLEDRRGNILFAILALARIQKPEYLFAENVTGLLSINKGETFAQILLSLDELGYDTEWQVIDSADYLPQHRERVYIVGHLRKCGGREIFPLVQVGRKTHVISGQNTDTITARYGEARAVGSYTAANRDNEKIRTLMYTRRQQARVYSADGIAPCITTGTSGNTIPKFLFGERIRRLTPKECWRLQGFPDELFEKAAAVNSDSQLYKQAGNSVTVPVIRAIGERL